MIREERKSIRSYNAVQNGTVQYSAVNGKAVHDIAVEYNISQ